jgi:CRP/FNR family cyclic AMP-dependent transcriptional regulator
VVENDAMFQGDEEHSHTYDAGATIFEAGDAAEGMYVVIYGAVEIRLHGKVLERVLPGGIIGEMALIEELPRSATAVALEETRLNVVNKERFLDLVRQNPYFALQVMEALAGRLRRMNATFQQNA